MTPLDPELERASSPERLRDRMRGVLLGTAVGDALGLPAEGVSRQRARKLFPEPWRHRFLFGKGMISDDTEHTIFVAQSLLVHPDSPARFARRLGWSLRGWLLALPAGIGWATLRAIVKLWCGVSPERSGVFSAGNGPAMRVAPIGAFFAHDPARLDRYVVASTQLTHSDPRALVGSMVVARLTAICVGCDSDARPETKDLLELLGHVGADDAEWAAVVSRLSEALARDLTVEEFADLLGLQSGVSGYVYHTVPIAVYAWFRHFGDYSASLVSVLRCGGDTDTAGAIVGALAGATVGELGIPHEWLADLSDWPRGRGLLTRLADRLAGASSVVMPSSAETYFWPGILPRNLVFLIVVLAHGFRRLAPPYR